MGEKFEFIKRCCIGVHRNGWGYVRKSTRRAYAEIPAAGYYLILYVNPKTKRRWTEKSAKEFIEKTYREDNENDQA